ncbi:MAG TPA: transglutaminase domain-containing protein, partial [Gemmataceae bacterium]|nr:transglutaminase domain-containing protein [Gemmataceae bacterium]
TTSYFVVSVDGTKSAQEQKTIVYYDLEGEGTVLYAEDHNTQDGQETVRTAVRQGDGLLLSTEVGDRKMERSIPMPKNTLTTQRRLEDWLQSAKPGDKFDNWTTDWSQTNVDVKEVYTFKEKKTVNYAGVDTPAYTVQTLSQGARFDGQVLADARILTGKVGVMEQRLEKEPLAKKLDDNVDLMAATSIPVDKSIGRASRIEKLTLEMTGLDDYPLPESARQKVVSRKDGVVVLQMTLDKPTDKPTPLSEEERKENLQATPAMQADSDKIQALAKEIVGDEKDPIKKATKLERWVYKNLRKTYDANADDALTVLANKAGDCTEHTLLFTTLARAAGIPAREVGGAVYVGGEKPSFGWHAWSEIHDGTQWVTVDPTFNQVYIDPTHIKFSEGEEDQAYLNVAGKLKVKVLEVEKKK